MKLELKHLAPYLPYGLNILHWNGNAKEYIEILQVLHLENRHVLGSDKHKPILRPLSDLTKEIEHYGEKFVPIDNFIYKTSVEDFTEFTEQKHNLTHGLKYADIQLLLEWHFDIFGLIEKGLAVCINTLKK